MITSTSHHNMTHQSVMMSFVIVLYTI